MAHWHHLGCFRHMRNKHTCCHNLPQAVAQDSMGMDAETFQLYAHGGLENEYTNLGNFTLIN